MTWWEKKNGPSSYKNRGFTLTLLGPSLGHIFKILSREPHHVDSIIQSLRKSITWSSPMPTLLKPLSFTENLMGNDSFIILWLRSIVLGTLTIRFMQKNNRGRRSSEAEKEVISAERTGWVSEEPRSSSSALNS